MSNFFCGPAGIGLFILGTICGWIGQESYAPLFSLWNLPGSLAGFSLDAVNFRHLTGLLGPILVGIGLLSVAAEAGRPFRGFNVFRNAVNSWMSRESVFAMGFIVLAGLDTVLLAHPAVQTLAGLAGLGVAISQGMILRNSKGVPAWSVPIMPHHFVASALATGMGGYLVITPLINPELLLSPTPYLVGTGLIALSLTLWLLYLSGEPHTATFSHSIAVLKRPSYLAGIVGLGHVLPALILLSALAFPERPMALPVLAGLAMLAGGLIARIALIMKAAFWVDLFDGFEEKRASLPAAQMAPRTAAEAA